MLVTVKEVYSVNCLPSFSVQLHGKGIWFENFRANVAVKFFLVSSKLHVYIKNTFKKYINEISTTFYSHLQYMYLYGSE